MKNLISFVKKYGRSSSKTF